MTIRLCVSAALLAFACQSASAEFVNINFDNDTIGNAPTVGASSNPVTMPNALGGYWSDTINQYGDTPPAPQSGTILVGNSGTMSKAAIYTTNPTNNEMGALYMDTGFSKTSQIVTLSFDLNVITAPASATVQPKFLNNTTTQAGILFGINAFTTDLATSQQSFRFAVAPTSSTGGVLALRSANNTNLISFFDYNNGDTHNVMLVADYSTGTVDAYVDGTQELAGHPFLAAGTLPNATTGEFFMFLNGQSGYANSIAIDNITAGVPEPASIALLTLGAGSLLLRRRKK